ncbi:MAG: bile acid:sodium symporter family protein [Tissierellia bacterium]|nr:bile acid:sodium symporter family protein [Tissierellia bacterium]
MALSLTAFFIPAPFMWILNHTALLLGLAMFGMGTTIQSSDFKQILRRPKEVLIGCLAQFTIMPLVAWLLAVAFKLPADLALGVILVGCCPGGTASNVITHIAKGDVALSVSMTIASTLLAPILTPLWVYVLADKWVDVSFGAMFKTVVTIILIPVVLGILTNHLMNQAKEKGVGRQLEGGSAILPLISSVAIIILISGIVAANADKIMASGLLTLVVVAIHNLCGLLLGLAIAKGLKIDYKKGTAIAIEVGMQNSGLAISLAALNFAANPLATLPGAIFSVWHNLTGSAFAGLRRNKQEKLVGLEN